MRYLFSFAPKETVSPIFEELASCGSVRITTFWFIAAISRCRNTSDPRFSLYVNLPEKEALEGGCNIRCSGRIPSSTASPAEAEAEVFGILILEDPIKSTSGILNKEGVTGIKLNDYPSAFGELLNNQTGAIKLTTDAVINKSFYEYYSR